MNVQVIVQDNYLPRASQQFGKIEHLILNKGSKIGRAHTRTSSKLILVRRVNKAITAEITNGGGGDSTIKYLQNDPNLDLPPSPLFALVRFWVTAPSCEWSKLYINL